MNIFFIHFPVAETELPAGGLPDDASTAESGDGAKPLRKGV